jgi:hypothetical protein
MVMQIKMQQLAAMSVAVFLCLDLLSYAEAQDAPKNLSAKQELSAGQSNRYKLSAFLGRFQKEGPAKEQEPVFETVVTANKPFEYKMKRGLGANGVLRVDKEGRLHFKGRIEMSPVTGYFDMPVELGDGHHANRGYGSGGFAFDFFVKFERAEDDVAKQDDVDLLDERPLILEMRAAKNVVLEVMVSAGSDFRVVSTIKGRKWSVTGTLHKVVDDIATISAMAKLSSEDYSSGQGVSAREFKIGELGNSWGSGSWGGIHVHFWIRRGVDPVPSLKRILARRDETFWHAAWYATELVNSKSRQAVIPELIDALNAEVDRPAQSAGETIRSKAAQTLGNFGLTAKAAIPALVQRLKDENRCVRVDAAIALWRIQKHESAIPALIAEVDNETYGIRHRVVSGLGDVAHSDNSATVVPVLTKSLQDQHHGVRVRACYSLAEFGKAAKTAVSALTEARSDPDEDVRKAAAYALEKIGR